MASESALPGTAVLRFDGQNGKVDIPYAAALNPSGQFSVQAWANLAGGSGHRAVLTSRDDYPQRGYIFYATPENRWQFWVGTGAGWAGLEGPAVVPGAWAQLTGTYDAGTQTMMFYVNGQQFSRSGVGFSPNTAKPLRIGAGATESSGAYFFNGQVAEVRVWNRVLSAAEIEAAAHRALSGYESGLVGYWRLGEGAGLEVKSPLASAPNGQLINGVAWKTASDHPITAEVAATPPGDVLVDIDFSALPEPFQSLAVKLQDALNSEVGAAKGDIELTTDLLGEFSIFESLFGLESLSVLLIKDAMLQIVGEAGADLAAAGAAGKLGLQLSGTSALFGADLLQARAVFFLDTAGNPSALVKLTPPESAGQSWGIGSVFPDIPIVAAMKFDAPAMVLSSEEAEDDELSFGIAEGFNYYGDIAVRDSADDMLNFIGGIFGVDTIATHAAIAKTNAGPRYTLEAEVEQEVTVIPGDVFNLKFMGSGIALEIIGGEPTISIANSMQLMFKWIGAEKLYFTGMVKAEPESVTGSFTLNKAGAGGAEWVNPFGIPGITIRQLAVQMGLTYAPPWIDNLGIAGDMKIGTIDGSLAILVDANDPDQFVLAGQTQQITLLEVMSALSPATFVAYQALPANIRSTINKVVDVKLTGIDQDGVKLNIVPVATKIGALEFNEEGITLKGKLVAWGWGAQANINVSTTNLLVDARMDAINLANAFKLSGAGSDANPRLYLQIGSAGSPELYVSAKLYLLGVSRELRIEATTKGLEFQLTDKVGTILTLKQACVLADNRLETSGSIKFNLNTAVGPVKVAGVTVADKITLADIGFDAAVAMKITTAPSFYLTASGSFSFAGQNLTMPTLTLKAAPADFAGVYKAVQTQIADRASEIFDDLFKSGLDWAKMQGKAFIQFSGDAANVLKNAFNESADSAAKIMKNTLGKGANDIAKGLQNTYKLSSDAAAKVLKDAGFTAAQVAGALKDAYKLTAEAVAKSLKYANYGINEVGGAVTSAYNLSADGVAKALKGAGYAASEVGTFMKNVGGYADSTINAALSGAGYAASEVSTFMKNVFGGKWIPHVDIIPHIDHVDIRKY